MSNQLTSETQMDSKIRNPFVNHPMNKYIRMQLEALDGHVSREEISMSAGFTSVEMLKRIERGEAKASLQRLPEIARALFVDPVFLLGLGMKELWPNEKLGLQQPVRLLDRHAGGVTGNSRSRNEEIEEGAEGTEAESFKNLNFKVAPSFHKAFRMAAAERELTMIQLLELAFATYVNES